MTRHGALVIGIGNPDAGDDAVGSVIAEAVDVVAPAGVDVLHHEDPADLTLLWQHRELVVVVDAVRSGDPVGTVRTMVVGADMALVGERTAVDSWPVVGPQGTHDFGLRSAVALSWALGTLPHRLVLVGVEGQAFSPGDPMTPAVRAAVPAAMQIILGACRPAVSC